MDETDAKLLERDRDGVEKEGMMVTALMLFYRVSSVMLVLNGRRDNGDLGKQTKARRKRPAENCI